VTPALGRSATVVRTVAQTRLPTVRSVARPTRITPPLRPPAPPDGPSHRDVLRRWEELEWYSCTYCDASFGPMVVAEVDHIRPLAKGGCDEWANLAPACRDCNRLKCDLDMSDWLAILAGQLDAECDVPVTR
jgi:5-methylcytosine-specific restriction endonuclease McrA